MITTIMIMITTTTIQDITTTMITSTRRCGWCRR